MSKKTIYFIPGWASDSSVWKHIVPSVNSDKEVKYIDWSILLENTDCSFSTNSILVGWSIGGMLALELCKKKNKFSNLILIASTARMTEDDGYSGVPFKSLKAMKIQLKRKRERVISDFAENSCDIGNRQFISCCQKSSQNFTLENLQKGLSYLLEKDLRPDLSEINVPSVIIHAENDNIINVLNSCVLHENLNNSRLINLKTGGHALPLSKSEVISDIINELIV